MPKMVLPPLHFSAVSEFSGFLPFTKNYGQMVPELFPSASIYTRAFAFVLVSLHILHQITYLKETQRVSLLSGWISCYLCGVSTCVYLQASGNCTLG